MGLRITALETGDDDDGGWNIEGSGNPSEILFGNAVQVWAIAQDRPVTVYEAALVFHVEVALICQAIRAHPWMAIGGVNGVIEHDGE